MVEADSNQGKGKEEVEEGADLLPLDPGPRAHFLQLTSRGRPDCKGGWEM